MTEDPKAAERGKGEDAPRFPLYPLLLSLYPVLSLYASNQHELPLNVIWLPLLGAFVLGSAITAVLRHFRAGDSRYPLLAAVLVFAIYTFGLLDVALYRLARLTQMIPGSIWPIRLWMAAAVLPIGLLVWFQMEKRKGRERSRRIERGVALIVACLIALVPLIALMQLGAIPPLRPMGDAVTGLIWAVILAALLGLVLRLRRVPRVVHSLLNNISLCLVAVPLISVLLVQVNQRKPPETDKGVMSERQGEVELELDPAGLPDIIHVVFDAHSSPESLKREFGLDCSEFLRQLEARGFSIAPQATSSYYLTPLSLGSTFNYEHVPIHELSDGERGTDLGTVQAYFWNNRLFQRLRGWGYTIYSLESGYTISDGLPADVAVRGRYVLLRRFARLLMDLTPFRLVLPLVWAEVADHDTENYERIMASFERLPDLAGEPSPKFILAHFPTPHLPFVLDEHGDRLVADPEFQAMTQSRLVEPPESYEKFFRAYYPRQVEGLHRLTIRMLDELLPELKRPTVIILQGDHGSELDYILRDPTLRTMRERYSTLNAVHFPGGRPEEFRDNASLVNTYRIILDEYFGQKLPLLEDRYFFHVGPEGHLALFDVTGELSGSEPLRFFRADP